MVLFKYFIEINKFEINKTVLIIVYLIVTFTLSGILYKYYEKPTTDLRDKKVI
jgi:peptidoglycan/LPS O-acetylase OafA/YrhL